MIFYTLNIDICVPSLLCLWFATDTETYQMDDTNRVKLSKIPPQPSANLLLHV